MTEAPKRGAAKKQTLPDAGELRKRAEVRLVARPPAKAPYDAERLVCELQVHQIELEMQNEELLAARHKLEDALGRRTELFDQAPIGYVVLDARGSICEANLEASHMLGLPRDRLAGRRMGIFIAESDRLAVAELLDQVLATADARPPSTLDVVLSGDGSADAQEVRLIASRLGGDAPGVMLAMNDVTARKRVERALQNEIRGRDDFLAALSHELRNPLASVRTSLALFARVKPGAREARKARDIATRQVDHLAKIVDDLLDATRVSIGRIELERSHRELGELLRAALDDHRFLFDERGIALEGELAPGPHWVNVDGTRLRQVFSNLLVNAMKFTPRGGRVDVRLRAERGEAVVSVRDDGIGMEPELCHRVFAPFFQGPQALDRTFGGVGLGLALVKGLVELHDGTVKASSRGPGRGSTFEVRLSIVPAPPVGVEVPRPIPSTERRRVLVIDDAVDNAELLGELLKVAGHEARIAHDGPSGLALGRAFRPEFVFCDIGLPGMDGYEVARKMRADATLRRAHLVALSGYALAEDRRRSAAAGFDHHLAKPASWESIVCVLARRTPAPAVGRGSHSAAS
jgi:PAS domain S-box-containing protein